MADQKISALTELTAANLAATDELVVVDKSDTTMAASGTDKRLQAGVAEFAYKKLNLWKPTGTGDDSLPRGWTSVGNGVMLVSGRVTAIGGFVLLAGQTVTSITFCSYTSGGSGMTNQWFCLLDTAATPNVLAVTVDDGSTAWGASAAKTLSLSSPYTASADIAVYLGCCVVGTGVPSMPISGSTAFPRTTIAPRLCGISSSTSYTDPASLGSTMAWGSAGSFQNMTYCYWS